MFVCSCVCVCVCVCACTALGSLLLLLDVGPVLVLALAHSSQQFVGSNRREGFIRSRGSPSPPDLPLLLNICSTALCTAGELAPPPALTLLLNAILYAANVVCGPILVAAALCCLSMMEVSVAGNVLLAVGIWTLLAPKE